MRLLCFALLVSGCGLSDFEQAADRFAMVVHPASDALSREYDVSGDLCRDQERVSYLRGRIDAEWHGAAATPSAAYLTRSDEPPGDPARCQGADAEREVWARTLSVMACYGDSMSVHATQAGFDGAALAGAAMGLAQLADAAGASSMVSGALARAGDPLKFIADFALRKKIESDLRKEIGSRRFEAVLAVADRYLDLVDGKRVELQTTVRGAVVSLSRAPAEPPALVATFAANWYHRLEARARRGRIVRQLLDDVRKAYAELVAISAGDKSKSSTDRVGAIAGYAVDVAHQSAILSNLIAAGE